MNLKLSLVAVLSVVSTEASAVEWTQSHPHALSEAECTPVDLRPALGPARNQGNIGWCYANVTADMLTFQYRNVLRGERVSAGYTALVYNKGNDADPLAEGGAVSEAMNFAAREGLCPESLETDVLKSGPKLPIKQKLDKFVNFKRLYDLAMKNPRFRPAFDMQLAEYRKSDSTLFDLKGREIDVLLASTTLKTFPLEFGRMICGSHRVMAPPPYPRMSTINKENFGSFWISLSPYIHQQLDQKKPVAVGYAAQFLSTANLPNWKFGWTRALLGQTGPVSRHASLIVGRRWNGQRCEFILRNSWGTGCNYGNKNFAKPEKCEGGHLFVTEQFMERQMYRIFYFSDSFLGDLKNRANAVIN